MEQELLKEIQGKYGVIRIFRAKKQESREEFVKLMELLVNSLMDQQAGRKSDRSHVVL